MKHFKNTAAAGAMAVGLSMMAAPATALNFTYDGPAAGGFERVNHNVAPDAGNTLTSANGPGGTYTTPAGPFNVTENDAMASFIAWCFELEKAWFSSTQDYVSGGALSSSQEDRVLKVFDANYSDTFLTGTGNTDRGAALQLAVWDAIYDNDFDLETGTFQSVSATAGGTTTGTTPDAIFNLAQGYLTAADAPGVQRKYNLFSYSSDTRQDFGGVQAIPLPAAAWLLMFASGGLIAAKRRQARRAA